MGLCHPKPSAPKAPFDDDAPLVDAQPPQHCTEVPPPSRQDVIDEHHHRRLLAITTFAATLAAEGGYLDPATTGGGPTLAAAALVEGVRAIADARGRTSPRVRVGGLPSALPEMNALFLAGDAVGKVVDAVLDTSLH